MLWSTITIEEKHIETERNRQKQIETDKNKQKQVESDKNRHKQMELEEKTNNNNHRQFHILQLLYNVAHNKISAREIGGDIHDTYMTYLNTTDKDA